MAVISLHFLRMLPSIISTRVRGLFVPFFIHISRSIQMQSISGFRIREDLLIADPNLPPSPLVSLALFPRDPYRSLLQFVQNMVSGQSTPRIWCYTGTRSWGKARCWTSGSRGVFHGDSKRADGRGHGLRNGGSGTTVFGCRGFSLCALS